ncbi:MAG: hypothetical protein ACI30H_04920 [Paludibacteraceae bacterium]
MNNLIEVGNIYWGKCRENEVHPIVILGKHDGDYEACIISHGAPKDSPIPNVPMRAEHFINDPDKYQVVFENTYLVPLHLIKASELIDFSQGVVGKLSDEGLQFVHSQIDHLVPQTCPMSIQQFAKSFRVK